MRVFIIENISIVLPFQELPDGKHIAKIPHVQKKTNLSPPIIYDNYLSMFILLIKIGE
ncbi:hypothetical protein CLV62_101558 [Dysgonomonas alginatilytica]|uniref:Uncharacterized protein n=1 Tax=Dysgonomonas alginatilytica TaxID=1605892 RepID=A0A2V3PUH8_9BACT|nr:hypothetical protein [Dysgonomonas alginatilytica]PXV69289.1 hypothetical protein CLV62_101558 [Dysgonomonas alginatilytica]